MSQSMPLPQTLQEAVIYASDPDRVFNFMVSMRWPDGVKCVHCGCDRVGFISTRKRFKCKNADCRKQFSIKTGSVMEDSPLGLDKWFVATWMIANCKNGVSTMSLDEYVLACSGGCVNGYVSGKSELFVYAELEREEEFIPRLGVEPQEAKIFFGSTAYFSNNKQEFNQGLFNERTYKGTIVVYW